MLLARDKKREPRKIATSTRAPRTAHTQLPLYNFVLSHKGTILQCSQDDYSIDLWTSETVIGRRLRDVLCEYDPTWELLLPQSLAAIRQAMFLSE